MTFNHKYTIQFLCQSNLNGAFYIDFSWFWHTTHIYLIIISVRVPCIPRCLKVVEGEAKHVRRDVNFVANLLARVPIKLTLVFG